MNVAFIIPTGIGCTIGGHAGDATPAAKLIAQVCDKLILHPNVVNASDINEMPDNALYVEGSILDLFLEKEVSLREVKSNRILLVVNELKPETENAVNAARTTIGADITIEVLDTPLIMEGIISKGIAGGSVTGVYELIDQFKGRARDYDALAIATPIDVSGNVALEYFRSSEPALNPWGGIEAIVSKRVARGLGKPVAHAPVESDSTKAHEELFGILYTEVVDPRKAAEVISSCYLHCVLKGLHKAPRPIWEYGGISRDTISCLITPYGCIGAPHNACLDAGIPVIVVRENKTVYNETDPRMIYVENYLEAAGVVACMNAGITASSVRYEELGL